MVICSKSQRSIKLVIGFLAFAVRGCAGFSSHATVSGIWAGKSARNVFRRVRQPVWMSSGVGEAVGFSRPTEELLNNVADKGYYSAKSNQKVMDVLEAISEGNGRPDVALVFNNSNSDSLVGMFTAVDFVDYSRDQENRANTPMEKEAFLMAPVSDYVTPAAKLFTVTLSDTANKALNLMSQNNIRHILVADKTSPDRTYLSESEVFGVLSISQLLTALDNDQALAVRQWESSFSHPLQLSLVEERMKDEANVLASKEEQAKKDIIRAVTAFVAIATTALFFSQATWLHTNAALLIISLFIIGYAGIILEEIFEMNKAAVALLMSTGLWVAYADYYNSLGHASDAVILQLKEQLADVSDICFFLLAASTIVEVVDAHQGFKVVTNLIQTESKKTLFWIIGILTFFLSAVLNNLTVTIVMVSLLRKLISDVDDRKLFGAMVVVAANAGGVFTPIGDVTTTMLWINNNLSTIPTITQLFFPSIVCLIASLAFISNQVKDDETPLSLPQPTPLSPRGQIVFWFGIISLLCVPVFSELTGLPPYLAMLTGLGAIWALTDLIHMGEKQGEPLRVPAALNRLDTAGILFFLGILMSIGVLDQSGLLKELALFFNENLPNNDIIATVIGLASAVIDNVPLVAATMGMYDLNEYTTDDRLWQLIAYCAGTGGSILVIGSASGVALMGLEKVDFLWYAKKVSIGAAVGYFAGIAAYLLQTSVLSGGLFGMGSPAGIS